MLINSIQFFLSIAIQDNKVTQDEWLKMWDECYKNKQFLPDWQLNYCNFFFDITDTSGTTSFPCYQIPPVPSVVWVCIVEKN